MNFIWFLAPLLLVACSHTPAARAPDGSADDMPPAIIDAHVHLDSVRESGSLDEFTQNQVEGVVSHSPGPSLPAIGRSFPFKTKICAGIVPGATVAQVESALNAGRVSCMKIYLGYERRWASDAFYRPFYKLAEKKQAVVVFHTGDTLDKNAHVKYADPLTID
jgi:hypothetical protein